jgi:hypothetical protein
MVCRKHEVAALLRSASRGDRRFCCENKREVFAKRRWQGVDAGRLGVLPQKNIWQALVEAAGSGWWPVLSRFSGYTCPSLWRVVAGRSAGGRGDEARQGPNGAQWRGAHDRLRPAQKKNRAASNQHSPPQGKAGRTHGNECRQDATRCLRGQTHPARPLDAAATGN